MRTYITSQENNLIIILIKLLNKKLFKVVFFLDESVKFEE